MVLWAAKRQRCCSTKDRERNASGEERQEEQTEGSSGVVETREGKAAFRRRMGSNWANSHCEDQVNLCLSTILRHLRRNCRIVVIGLEPHTVTDKDYIIMMMMS